jgi:hypothetical protein
VLVIRRASTVAPALTGAWSPVARNQQAKYIGRVQLLRGTARPEAAFLRTLDRAPRSSRMQRYHHISALFDAPGDMLHIAIGGPGACYEAAARGGMVYRYAPAGNRPSGVRVQGFLARWVKRRDRGYAEIARFLGADAADIRRLVEAQLTRRAARHAPRRRNPPSDGAHERP